MLELKIIQIQTQLPRCLVKPIRLTDLLQIAWHAISRHTHDLVFVVPLEAQNVGNRCINDSEAVWQRVGDLS